MFDHRSASRLRTKIIAWSFIPTAIILFLVALTVYFAYQQLTVELAFKRDEELTRLSAAEVSSSMEEYLDRLTALARQPKIYNGNPAQQREALFAFRNQLVFYDGGVYLLNNLGKVVGSQPNHPGLVGLDWSYRSFFSSMMRLPGQIISDVEPAGPDGEEVIAMAVPVLGEQEELRGVVIGMFRLNGNSASPFFGTLIKLRIGLEGQAYVVDKNRRVVYASNTNLIGARFTQEIAGQAFTGQVGVRRFRDERGQYVVAGYAPVPRTNWTLIVEQDWNQLTRPTRSYQQFLLLLLILGIAIPTSVVIFGVRRITGPIADFISAAQRIADGDFSHPITVNTGDELEELANQFNRMADRLEELYATLETRVDQRTQELRALNSVAAVASRSLDLEQILSDALAKTIEVLDMDAGAVFRLEAESGILYLVAQQGLSPELVALIRQLPVGASVIQQVVLSRQPVVRLVADYPPGLVREVLERDGWKSVVSVPLLSQEKVLGAMNIPSRSLEMPVLEELAVPSAIGQQIGVAMDNARLYKQTVEYARQMEAARQLAETARAAAEAANTAKSDFLANVSHELRTPLVSIFGFARITQKRLEERIFSLVPTGDERAQRAIHQVDENLKIILNEGQRLMALINNLLDLEKIEAGQVEWHFQPVAIGEIIRQAASSTAALFAGRGQGLQVELQDNLPILNGDPDRLVQVLINLISNAVKFAPHGSITVRARLRGREVLVSVIDHGVGISPADQALVFEKFKQVGDTLTSKPTGTGLGLSISKEIIERHQGRIWLESEPGQGSIFSFALPVPDLGDDGHLPPTGQPGSATVSQHP